MSVTLLNYYRVTCDDPECDRYINVAARDNRHLVEVLDVNKWQVTENLYLTYCPQHQL